MNTEPSSEAKQEPGIQARINIDGHDYILVSSHYVALNEQAAKAREELEHKSAVAQTWFDKYQQLAHQQPSGVETVRALRDEWEHREGNQQPSEPYNDELAATMLNEGDFEGLANEVAKPSAPTADVEKIAAELADALFGEYDQVLARKKVLAAFAQARAPLVAALENIRATGGSSVSKRAWQECLAIANATLTGTGEKECPR